MIDLPGAQFLKLVADDKVSQVAGGDCAPVPQPEVIGRVYRRHLDGAHGLQPQADCLAHHGVDIAVLEQVATGTVIDHQQAAGVGQVRYQGQ